jgi:eukaryotic-like serine/threonine-protein kinase
VAGTEMQQHDVAELEGRYELRDVLATSGSVTVHRAVDHVLRRPVAIKLYGPEPGGQPRRLEMPPVAALHHPGLPTVYDAGIDGGRAYVVMALVDGPTLAERLDHGSLPIAETVALATRLSDALAHLHGHGLVVGRAISTADVRYRAAGPGAGVCALMTDGRRETGSGERAADVRALGMLMLEILGGRRFFRPARRQPRWRVAAHMPVPLRSLVAALVADDPAARPTARGAATCFDRLQHTLEPSASGKSGSSGTTGAVGFIVVAAAAALCATLWPRPSPAPADHTAPGVSRPVAVQPGMSQRGDVREGFVVPLADAAAVTDDHVRLPWPETAPPRMRTASGPPGTAWPQSEDEQAGAGDEHRTGPAGQRSDRERHREDAHGRRPAGRGDSER